MCKSNAIWYFLINFLLILLKGYRRVLKTHVRFHILRSPFDCKLFIPTLSWIFIITCTPELCKEQMATNVNEKDQKMARETLNKRYIFYFFQKLLRALRYSINQSFLYSRLPKNGITIVRHKKHSYMYR